MEIVGVSSGRRPVDSGISGRTEDEETPASCTTSRSSTSQDTPVYGQQGHFVYKLGGLAAIGTEFTVETFSKSITCILHYALRGVSWRR